MEDEVTDSLSWYEPESVFAEGKYKAITICSSALYIDVSAKRISQPTVLLADVFLYDIEILQSSEGMDLQIKCMKVMAREISFLWTLHVKVLFYNSSVFENSLASRSIWTFTSHIQNIKSSNIC